MDHVLDLLEQALDPATAEFSARLDRLPADARGLRMREGLRSVRNLAAGARRQRMLTLALSDTAAAISSLREGDNALREIVTRTRAIVGTDMAYISLNDPGRGETRITETDGVWTQAYRDIRMPFNTGVLGRVARADGPIQVSDYLAAMSVEHLEHIDAAVAKEGVKAILGAPMRIGGDIIGALLVADRWSHEFSQDQIFAVEALANQAAVALDNLERLAELTDSMTRLETANRDKQSSIGRLERLAAADEELFAALSSAEGLPGLAARLSSILGRQTRLLNLTVRIDAGDVGGERLHAARALIPASRHTNAPVTGTLEDGTAVVVMASVIEGETLGGVLVEGELSADDDSILRRAALVLGTFISHSNASRRERERQRAELLATLISPPSDGLRRHTATAAAAYGVEDGSPFRVALVDGAPRSLVDFEESLEANLGEQLLRAHFNDRLYLAAPERVFGWMADFLGRRGARQWGGVRMAHSETLDSLAAIGAEFALAERILTASRSLPQAGNVVGWRSLGTIGIFLANADSQVTQSALRSSLGPLLDYDAAHGTQLCDTALCYLDEGRNIARTAAALVVHQNTVRQRLERIDSLLGSDWNAGRRALDHHVLLVVARLLAGTPARR
ncbi:helix-turn-helix domain-containing protein [Arthrobacter mobilis]|uniref:GAF domain-containing protein n=1 Tax=Arthrobacter mobilis TaxID=2724944 RepID=A0A7X6K320_9MICC|nr:helix-turn-helix domain-containing protein [Arthrobacter mobilis]NKX53050.1 GAF domain-containing protein [Arthrobacter mobilis]